MPKRTLVIETELYIEMKHLLLIFNGCLHFIDYEGDLNFKILVSSIYILPTAD